MSLLSNLRIRSRLLRTALTKRFVFDEIVGLALAHGNLPVEDVAGNLEPVDLLHRLAGGQPFSPPDFSALVPGQMLSVPTGPKIWSSERNAAEFVGRLTALMHANVVCEIGCFIGYTTTHIATALRAIGHGRLHYVDLNPDFLDTAAANLRRLGLEHLGTPHLGASHDPATLALLPASIDLVFVDTTHTYQDTTAEIAAYGSRLSSRGCLVLHDSIRFPGVRQAVAKARDVFDVLSFATERGNGMSVLVRKN